MRPTGFEPLSPSVERLLAEERNFLPESAELRARAMNRARESLRAPEGPLGGSFRQRHSRLLLAAALVTAIAAAAMAAWQNQQRSAARRTSVAPSASGVTAGAPHARVPQPPVPALETPTSQPSEAEPGSSAKSSIAAPRPLSANDAYALELGLLQRARAAVASGGFSTALEAIAEHERRFPSGRLREEREALRVKALVGLGRHDEARAAAERFRRRFPHSVLSTHIEETTRQDP